MKRINLAWDWEKIAQELPDNNDYQIYYEEASSK